ncbi:hypothetical protein NBM05_08940 [Rothia sp. AR01]|uniref:Uncharacterized protein n=1 Tax=Rothia santali TaxID=2949643 RepID=A0A9X2KHR4_9MICC|nr:hypothetical protein [Rothia santali]MCP3426127.1 hypothetical protein [Rothia santali]
MKTPAARFRGFLYKAVAFALVAFFTWAMPTDNPNFVHIIMGFFLALAGVMVLTGIYSAAVTPRTGSEIELSNGH